jgi:predicted small lipoprotein YifL
MRAMILVTAFVSAILLPGCGIKGPLLLPPTKTPTPAPADGYHNNSASPVAPTPSAND